MELTSLEGNRQRLDGGSMFGNAPRAVWEKWTPPDERGRIELACRSFLIQWKGLNILIETGIGSFFEPKLAERFGVQTPSRHLLSEELGSLGLTPQDIHFVVLSHLHFDHAGGLLPTYENIKHNGLQLLFSKAQFIVSQQAWERALHPHDRDRASFIPGLTDQLKNSGRLNILGENQAFPSPLDEAFEFVISNGHTPGQLLTIVKGSRQKAFFTGDLIPGRHWVHLPITMGYDRFPEQVIDEKAHLYEKALDEHWILLFTHDDQVAGATVKKLDNGKVVIDESFSQFRSFQLS